MSLKFKSPLAAFGLSFVLASYSTIGNTATAAPAPVNPFAVMGAFGSPASAAALCGNVTSTATAGVATAAQAPAPGCVLPVVETAAPVAQDIPAPSPMVAVANNAILPALLVISGIAAWALLFALESDDDDDDGDIAPISA